MTQLEDQLRLAFRARASDITPPPPPLELQPRPVLDPAARRGSGGLGTPPQRWLVPLAAAVAVLAVVAGALAAGSVHPAHRMPPTTPIQTVQTSVPRYYVALVADRAPVMDGVPLPPDLAPSAVATVRDTTTGSILARVKAPSPYIGFSMVAGADDDRTFVLLAIGHPVKRQSTQQAVSERFYLLHINPSSPSEAARAQLTALPASDVPGGAYIDAMALSPDGQALAAFVDGGSGGVLTVYYLETGTTRTWVWRPPRGTRGAFGISRGGYGSGTVVLSWTANGKAVGFAPDPWSTLWVLDLAKPGNNLKRNITPFRIHGVPVQTWNVVDLTPDGKSAFVSYYESFGQSDWMGLDRFSAATGKLTVINKLTVTNEGNATGFGIHALPGADTAADDVLWSSYDGSKFVVVSARPGNTAGIYSGNRYTPIPWPANVLDAAW
jgi:hypothetical protein